MKGLKTMATREGM